jgi:hypothetical protein
MVRAADVVEVDTSGRTVESVVAHLAELARLAAHHPEESP